jgi:light-regulated signal transduction histidine kinase (bacteriophytochrome)
LRSPLRAIDGFARIFEEDYQSTLDDEGRRLLKVIRDNSQKMGQLIDDLLSFSRLGRTPVARGVVDMNALVAEVLNEIKGTNDASEIVVEPLPSSWCDRALIRQVWINLLSNAFKYSGARDDRAVVVSGRQSNNEIIYCVKDNGVGFDMKYYDKLFGVFQRLHSAEEFPGTGVGLAIVQRVVSRSGGKVWAKSAPGQGAEFCFTLPIRTDR